jgi:hypothetical protein
MSSKTITENLTNTIIMVHITTKLVTGDGSDKVQDINSYRTMLSKARSKTRKNTASMVSGNNVRHKKI